MPVSSINRVITHWQTQNANPGVSVMFFDAVSVPSVAALRSDVADFWTAVDGLLTNSTTWEVDPEVVLIDPTSGALTGVDVESTLHQGTGEATEDEVSNASQLLLRWQTGQIVAGRRLQGRTFVPGLSKQQISGGQVLGLAAEALAPAITDFINAAPLVIWHRPVGGAGGSWEAVTSGSVWNEMAVLRRRR